MKINKLDDNAGQYIKLAVALGLIIFAIYARLLPHPANFAPVAAVALFAGAVFPKKIALTIPLLAIVISDFFIGLHSLIFFTWGGYLLIVLFGSYVIKKINPDSLILGAFGSSLIFFFVTNFGVWLEGRLYTRSLDGLISCFVNAIPFYRNTLLSDLLFTSIIFSTYYLFCKLYFDKQTSLKLNLGHQK